MDNEKMGIPDPNVYPVTPSNYDYKGIVEEFEKWMSEEIEEGGESVFSELVAIQGEFQVIKRRHMLLKE